ARYADMDVRLTPIESRYLGLLMSHNGNTVSLQTFYEVLCDAEGESARHFDQTNKQNIRTHICYLRKKLGQDSNSEQLIETVRTKGYRLVSS
ncbi:MAG: helix-turn-helix domain-containing protein, partial [Caldilineaceae bacterium]|nr:helix-turn-helix domain-containing protein [Caldilineaceae bacterium]